MATIGFVGIGDMGSRLVPHLIDAGHRVTVYDVRPERMAAMVTLGALEATKPAGVARTADVVISAVRSADILASHLGPDSILGGLRPGATLVVTSTTTPGTLKTLEVWMPGDAYLVDAMMVGSVRCAAEGALTVLLGGADAATATVTPILQSFGEVVHVGPLGAGVAYKLITNVAVMAAEAGLREALDLTDQFGGEYDLTLSLLARGPLAAIVNRALDRDNPCALSDSAADFDVLLEAGGADNLPLSAAGRTRLRAATAGDPPPACYDLTTHRTALPEYRSTGGILR